MTPNSTYHTFWVAWGSLYLYSSTYNAEKGGLTPGWSQPGSKVSSGNWQEDGKQVTMNHERDHEGKKSSFAFLGNQWIVALFPMQELFSFTLGPTHVANPELMLSRARTCHIHRASSVPIDIAHTVMEGLCGGPWCHNLFWLELWSSTSSLSFFPFRNLCHLWGKNKTNNLLLQPKLEWHGLADFREEQGTQVGSLTMRF